MSNKLTGSNLTRAMLKRGDKNMWCAVDDDSDEQAMNDHVGNGFTEQINSFSKGKFFSVSGVPWLYAVPIKLSEVTSHEVGF